MHTSLVTTLISIPLAGPSALDSTTMSIYSLLTGPDRGRLTTVIRSISLFPGLKQPMAAEPCRYMPTRSSLSICFDRPTNASSSFSVSAGSIAPLRTARDALFCPGGSGGQQRGQHAV